MGFGLQSWQCVHGNSSNDECGCMHGMLKQVGQPTGSLRREHRKALEEIFLETTWAMNRTYHSDAHDRIVLTGPRN